MLILFIMMLFVSLATLASRLCTALQLEAETVQATLVSYRYEEYLYGSLNYGMVYLVQNEDLPKIIVDKGESRVDCDVWNTAADGQIRSVLVYTRDEQTYCLEISLYKADTFIKKMKAHIVCEEYEARKSYSCVAIETF